MKTYPYIIHIPYYLIECKGSIISHSKCGFLTDSGICRLGSGDLQSTIDYGDIDEDVNGI